MPIGGETIGTAYVRILADGSGLDRSIRDQMDDIDWDKNTRKTTSELVDKFQENMERDVNQRKLREAIADPLARGNWLSTTFFRSNNWRNFRSGLSKEYGEAGSRAGESLERGLLEGTLSHSALKQQLENMGPLLAKMQRDINRETSAAAALAEKHGIKMKEGTEQSAAAVRKEITNIQNLRREFADLNLKVKDYAKGINVVEGERDRPALLRDLEGIAQRFRDAGIADLDFNRRMRDTRKEINFAHPVLTRMNNGLDKFADGVGRAFGKGSRNDFVNIIGSMAGAFARLPMLFTRGAEALTNWVTSIRTANGPLRALGAGLAPFGAMAGGIAAAFGLLGPLLSGLSMVAGVLVALSSTVIMGLAGSVGVLAASIAPLVAGIGVAVLGFMNMPPAAKRAVESVKDQFKGLGKVAAGQMFKDAGKDAERLKGIIGNLTPITRRLGDAVHDVMQRWLTMAESPATKAFRADMERFLPGAVRKLGRIMGEAFGGFGGMLRALIPQTRIFLNWLVDVTDEFNSWANSTRGQNSLKRFFADAADSAKSLGGFLGAATRLLGTLISHGNEAGDSMFGGLTRALDGWNKSLKANNGAGLDRWFEDAKRFGKAIGDIFSGFGRLFATLDTEMSRAEITGVFEALAGVLKVTSSLLGGIARIAGSLGSGFIKTAAEVATAAYAFAKLKAVVIATSEAMLLMQASAGASGGKMMMLGSAARTAAGVGGLLALVDSTNRASKGAGALEGALGGAGLGATLGSIIPGVGTLAGAAIGGVAGGLFGLATSGNKANDSVKQTASAISKAAGVMEGYRDTINETTGAITEMTRARAYDNLQAAGAIQKGNALKISTTTMINASLGMPGAMAKVRAAVDAANASLDGATFKFGKNGEVIATMTAEQRKAAKGANDLASAIGLAAEKSNEDILAMRNRAIALGHTKKLLKDIPDEVITSIKQTGLEAASTGIVALTKKYKLTPPQVKTILEAANVNPTKAQVQSIIDKAKELGRQNPKPRVEVQPGNSLNTLLNLRNGINNLHDKTVNILVKTVGGVPIFKNPTARGGMFNGAQQRTIAEEGPEAVVPLNRPLSQVDPAVRWLSAIAQGKLPGMASGGVVGGGGRTVNVGGIQVVSSEADPKAVAIETVNRLVGVGY